jgi:hypothetical protein
VPTLPPIGSPVANTSQANNLSKVLVITKNDLDRISGHLNRRQNEEEALLEEQRRRKELHEKSQELTRNWNNTIHGARRYKLEQKKIREDKLEDKRKAIDLEHAQYLAEERRKAIDQAKLLQYHETDKIKTFHVNFPTKKNQGKFVHTVNLTLCFLKSAMKLSEVLKERDAQVEMKKVLDQLNREREIELEMKNMAISNIKYKEDDSLCIKKQEEIARLTDFLKKQ